jgi:hypothetical protein
MRHAVCVMHDVACLGSEALVCCVMREAVCGSDGRDE